MRRKQKNNSIYRLYCNPKYAGLFHRLTVFLVACIALISVYMVLAKASRPFRVSYAESREIASIEKMKDAAERENRRLKSEKKYLLSDKGKESEAHKLGWVKDGEVSIVVEQPDQSPIPQLEPKKVANKKSVWRAISENTIGKLLFHREKSATER